MARQLIATDVIAVQLQHIGRCAPPNYLLPLVSCCFQILESGCDNSSRGKADLVIAPKVGGLEWNALGRGPEMIEASEAAALDTALPRFRNGLPRAVPLPHIASN